MTHRPNAMTHTQEYRECCLGWYDIHLLFSVFSRRQTCAPPDTKSWRCHWPELHDQDQDQDQHRFFGLRPVLS